MKLVIQRVSRASIRVDGEEIAGIGRGLMVLIGVGCEDDAQTAEKLARKMTALRIFEDAAGKTNLSLADVDGELLLISQFTLYADTSHGHRPGFTDAARPEQAIPIYEHFVACCRQLMPEGRVQTGRFGADMKVELVNDGPFTILM